MSRDKKLPASKIKEGIVISLQKAKEHLDSAVLLIDNGFLDNAVGPIEFAIEEFGRAVYLRDRLNKGLETIENALEKSHWLKYDEAFSVLPKDLKTIWEDTIFGAFPKGYWPKGYWAKGWWGEGVVKQIISPLTRTNAIFTHFDGKTQTWQSGVKADGKKLMGIVDVIRKYIGLFKF